MMMIAFIIALEERSEESFFWSEESFTQ